MSDSDTKGSWYIRGSSQSSTAPDICVISPTLSRTLIFSPEEYFLMIPREKNYPHDSASNRKVCPLMMLLLLWFFFSFLVSREHVPGGESLPHKFPSEFFLVRRETGEMRGCLEEINEPTCQLFQEHHLPPFLFASSSAQNTSHKRVLLGCFPPVPRCFPGAAERCRQVT